MKRIKMKKYFVVSILLSFNSIISSIVKPDSLQSGYRPGQQNCGSFSITSPYASSCWYGWNSSANHADPLQHLALMPAGSTCEKTNPNCILNPYNSKPSWVDPHSYSTLCKPYIDDVKTYTTDAGKKQLAINLAKACLIGYDTYHTGGCWCSNYQNHSLYNQ